MIVRMSPHPRSTCILRALLAALLLALALPTFAAAQEATPAATPVGGVADTPRTGGESGAVRDLRFSTASWSIDPAAFEIAWGPVLHEAVVEIGAVLPPQDGPVRITLYRDDAELAAAEPSAIPEPGDRPPAFATGSARIAVAVDPLLARSPLEAETALRHAVAHALVREAGGESVPAGFAEGFAAYVERPASARLARAAALVQDARARNDLLTWSDLNRPRAVIDDGGRFPAHAYSMVAFLVERYGLRTYGQLLASFSREPDWRSAMRATYQRPPEDLEAQWRDELPRWTAGGWRENLFAGFDLQPARDLLATGRYAGAQREVERSLRLFTDLGLTERQAEAEPILRQAEQALQAEALMEQVEQALGRKAWERAGALLDQAEVQYQAVPADLQPRAIIDRYRTLSERGLQAARDLDLAGQRSASWQEYPEARAAALAAGSAYAELGDAEMHGQAVGLLGDLDQRQQRMTIGLGLLALLCAVWLGLWLWARGPSDLDWGA
jgi:hypothetical protein